MAPVFGPAFVFFQGDPVRSPGGAGIAFQGKDQSQAVALQDHILRRGLLRCHRGSEIESQQAIISPRDIAEEIGGGQPVPQVQVPRSWPETKAPGLPRAVGRTIASVSPSTAQPSVVDSKVLWASTA